MSGAEESLDVEGMELGLLLEGVYQRYGFDFREYEPARVRRVVEEQIRRQGLGSVSGLQEKILRDRECLERLVLGFTERAVRFFDEPGFFRSFRADIIPLLRTYPFVRLWDIGCSTGQETYSLAIVLEEEKMADRCRLYATEMSEPGLIGARAGLYPLADWGEAEARYLSAGGRGSLADYSLAAGADGRIHPAIQQRIVFAQHNVVVDGSFNEFNVIVCRDVLSRFKDPLRNHVLRLLGESLGMFGILALGSEDAPRIGPIEGSFERLSECGWFYRRVR